MNSFNYLVASAYGVSLFADPCILISAAAAVTLGGRAFGWGILFAAVHFVFGLAGLFISSQAAKYSELTGHLVAELLLIIVLSHVVRHAFNHGCDTCQGEEERTKRRLSSRSVMLFGSLMAVTAHALGAGFVLGITLAEEDPLLKAGVLLGGACLLGCLVSTVVKRRSAFGGYVLHGLRFFPGISVTLLCLMLGFLTEEILDHAYGASFSESTPYYKVVAFTLSLALGFVVQSRSSAHKHEPALPVNGPTRIGRISR